MICITFIRLTRLDATALERNENLRSEVREITRKLNSIEWFSAKYEATLEDIRSTVDQIKCKGFVNKNIHIYLKPKIQPLSAFYSPKAGCHFAYALITTAAAIIEPIIATVWR